MKNNGLSQKIKPRGQIGRESLLLSPKKLSDIIRAGIKWNKLIAKYTDTNSKGMSMYYIFKARLNALCKFNNGDGLFGIYGYFHMNWPHLCDLQKCVDRCQGDCLEEHMFKCKMRIVMIIRKLCFSNDVYLDNIMRSKHSPKNIEIPQYRLSAAKTPVEIKENNCKFHPEEKAVLKIGESKTSICSLCRSRSVTIITSASRNLEENEILSFLKMEASKDKNKP